MIRHGHIYQKVTPRAEGRVCSSTRSAHRSAPGSCRFSVSRLGPASVHARSTTATICTRHGSRHDVSWCMRRSGASSGWVIRSPSSATPSGPRHLTGGCPSCLTSRRPRARPSGAVRWRTPPLHPPLDNPALPDNPLHINEEKGPLGDAVLGQDGIAGQPTVLPGHLHLREVAEEGVRQVERLGQGLLRKGMVRADPENRTFSAWNWG